jgi:hypothetical protein
MLSTRLVHIIEDHWQAISSSVISQIRSDPSLRHIRALPETELREIGRTILRNLGHWLTAPTAEHEIIGEQYETIGRLRFAENIPLCECVRALQIVKRKTMGFIADQGFAQSSVDMYGANELERRVDAFFDDLIYHEVIGYERAMRQSAGLPVETADGATMRVRLAGADSRA